MTEPRASTTDPQARRMRFADGAMRPGYNVQVAVTADHGLITAIEATDRRQNTGLAKPMIEVTEARLGCHVKRLLADTVYASQDDIEALATRAEFPVTSYVALPEARADVKPASLAERARKRARARVDQRLASADANRSGQTAAEKARRHRARERTIEATRTCAPDRARPRQSSGRGMPAGAGAQLHNRTPPARRTGGRRSTKDHCGGSLKQTPPQPRAFQVPQTGPEKC